MVPVTVAALTVDEDLTFSVAILAPCIAEIALSSMSLTGAFPGELGSFFHLESRQSIAFGPGPALATKTMVITSTAFSLALGLYATVFYRRVLLLHLRWLTVTLITRPVSIFMSSYDHGASDKCALNFVVHNLEHLPMSDGRRSTVLMACRLVIACAPIFDVDHRHRKGAPPYVTSNFLPARCLVVSRPASPLTPTSTLVHLSHLRHTIRSRS
ncbi:hypothetical protein B0H10DRAFT_1366190 [Mycena sp. CBHHK59/15]|nr:hypothetical protein B0H10DRAFT_1366190 [Mycena sp. CBHHK59/15]